MHKPKRLKIPLFDKLPIFKETTKRTKLELKKEKELRNFQTII